MSNDEPTPGQPPEDDPFLKKPKEPPPGSPYGGSSAPPPPPPGAEPFGGDPFGGPDPLAGMAPLATFGQRLLARIADALIVFIPLLILFLLVGGWNWSSDDGDQWGDFARQGRQWLWSLLSIIAYVGYDAVMTQNTGQTFGKRWMKLRVATLNTGAVPTGAASVMRAAVLWLPALICCFFVWWIVISVSILVSRPYRQGLHDKAAATVVVSAA
jgi:uncharacterized RDD family membrane protein YckC